MKMNKLINIFVFTIKSVAILFIACTLVALNVNGQACEQKLKDAEQSYQQGLLREIPEMLENCLRFGFNKEERERSYKLLILTNIFLDDMEKAEHYLLKLLRSNPQFTVNAIDPPELLHLYNGFRTKSVFSLEIKGGINTSFINTLRENGVGNGPNAFKTYKNQVGFQLGAGINYRILNTIEIAGEINLVNQRFEQIDSIRTTLFTDAERPEGYNFTAIEAGENQTWIEIPIAVKYGFKVNKFHPFVYVGASMKYLINAELNISRVNIDPSDIETPQRRVEGPPINLLNAGIRKNFQYSLLGGAGLKYQIGIDYLVFNLRYNFGLTDMRNKNAPLNADSDLLYRYGYIDDDFKINKVAISIGYVKPFYKPKKLKRKK